MDAMSPDRRLFAIGVAFRAARSLHGAIESMTLWLRNRERYWRASAPDNIT